MGCVIHTHGVVSKKKRLFSVYFSKGSFSWKLLIILVKFIFVVFFEIKVMTMSAFHWGKDCGLQKFTGANQNSFSRKFQSFTKRTTSRATPKVLKLPYREISSFEIFGI